MNTRPLNALGAVLALAGCAVTPPSGALPAAPVPTVTVTTTASPTATPSDEPTDEETDWQQPEPTFDPWLEAAWIFANSSDSRKPVRDRYLAVIKSASYDENAGGGLTATLDKVTWNSKYSDGNDEDPILNPVAKWETVHLGDVLVLVDAANGFRHVKLADFPAYVKDDDNHSKLRDGWRTPFLVYFIGDEPVALVERYVP